MESPNLVEYVLGPPSAGPDPAALPSLEKLKAAFAPLIGVGARLHLPDLLAADRRVLSAQVRAGQLEVTLADREFVADEPALAQEAGVRAEFVQLILDMNMGLSSMQRALELVIELASDVELMGRHRLTAENDKVEAHAAQLAASPETSRKDQAALLVFFNLAAEQRVSQGKSDGARRDRKAKRLRPMQDLLAEVSADRDDRWAVARLVATAQAGATVPGASRGRKAGGARPAAEVAAATAGAKTAGATTKKRKGGKDE